MGEWFWLVLVFVAVLIVGAIYWWWTQMRQAPVAPEEKALPTEWRPALPAPAMPEADDLAAIEGIGPRIHDVLHDAGITTFAQLADTPVERMREILVAAELHVPADPSTWPAQARLAAESRWQELKELQDSLKSGR